MASVAPITLAKPLPVLDQQSSSEQKSMFRTGPSPWSRSLKGWFTRRGEDIDQRVHAQSASLEDEIVSQSITVVCLFCSILLTSVKRLRQKQNRPTRSSLKIQEQPLRTRNSDQGKSPARLRSLLPQNTAHVKLVKTAGHRGRDVGEL